MKRHILPLLIAIAAVTVNAETVERSFYFDFGMDGGTRGEITTSPDANGNYWNNIGNQEVTSNKPSLSYIYSLVTAENAATALTLQLSGTKFTANGINTGGGFLTPDAELLGDLAIATATEDYLFASNSEHCSMIISGLDTDKGYQFKIFGSRLATDDRISDYTLRGKWAVQGSLQAAGTGIGANGENQNTSQTYLSPVIRPADDGTISLTVHRQYAGSGAYFPINCMRMQELSELHEAEAEIYIDCGHSDGSNGELTASPDEAGIYWNNLYDNNTSAAAVSLITTDNTATGASVTITSAFTRNGYNNGGNTADTYSALLGDFGQKSVMGDYFFVSGSATGKMLFSGLDPDKAYEFHIIGSRAYNSTFGQTVDKLRLQGLTDQTFTHHTGGNGLCFSGATNGWNEDAFSVSEPLFPAEDGSITLSLSANRGSYVHINAMRILVYGDYDKPETETVYSSVILKGTAVEDGEVTMLLRAADGVSEGTSFQTFVYLTNGGTMSFETAEGEVLSANTCTLSDGIYRIVYNTTSRTFTSTAITHVGLSGNITTTGWSNAGMTMTYRGNGIWRDTFDLPAYTGTDAERVQFCMNNSWSIAIKARNGEEGIVGFTPDQEDCEFSVEDIYMRHGRKDVMLDMQHFRYNFDCMDIAEEKITFFGSSVCNGQGADEVDNIKHGYAWQFGQLLAERATEVEGAGSYEYSNSSINGNNTTNLLSRYQGHMLGDCGKYVVIGLGLGNEGIHGAADPEAIYNQWKTNMQTLIGIAEEEGKTVIATNNYPRGDYNSTDYGYVKQMNLEMQAWDIPTVNMLGALDNCQGDGQWAEGYQNGTDIYHPNMSGHTEMMHSIVPSLFDALAAGKTMPTRQTGEGVSMAINQRLSFVPEDEVHSFTLAMRVKNINALALTLTLAEGTAPALPEALPTDNDWHTLVITHYYAAAKTMVYLDGALQSTTDGSLLLQQVTLSGVCSVSELCFYRAGMNSEEVQAWDNGLMLCSSLEIYCPLNEGNTDNLAQSTNTVSLITEDEPSALEQGQDSKTLSDRSFSIDGRRISDSFRGGVVIVNGEKKLR